MQFPRIRNLARSNAGAASWRTSPARVRRVSILAVLVLIASVSVAGLAITRGAHAATSSADPYTWGSNAQGFLGTGNSTQASGPTPNHISLGVTVKSVVSGSDAIHALAVGSDGSLWGWGDNTSNAITPGGQSYATPVSVAGVSGVTAAAAGASYTLALESNGTVLAWGANQDGQLGIGTTTSPTGPTQVVFPAGVTVKAISAGDLHSLAVDTNGNVWAWGYNGLGQLGNGTTNNSSVPVQVTSGTNFTAVAAGQFFSLALTSTGSVYAWGSNASGQLGNGTSGGSVATPTQVSSLSGVSSIAAGQTFGVAASPAGVYAWGDNTDGQIGNGSSGGAVASPSLVTGLSGVTATAVAAGDNHALALASSGAVYAWGFDYDGQVGANGGTSACGTFSYPCSLSAVLVTGLPSASAITAGTQFSMALVPQAAPIATLSATSLSFGGQVQGTASAAQSVTVTNTGSGSLSFSGVTVGGTNAADYTLTDGCSGQNLANGASCTIGVTFTPGAIGSSTATLTISDNDPSSPQTVALSGNGTYSWSGVQSSSGTTTFRAGSKVGLQFQLTGASAAITTAVGTAQFAVVTNGTPGTYTNTAGSPPNTGNTFSYTSKTSNYTYTWSTKGLSAGTYSVVVTLGDGSTSAITITLQ